MKSDYDIMKIMDGTYWIECYGRIYEFIGTNGDRLLFQDVNSVDYHISIRIDKLKRDDKYEIYIKREKR